MPKIASPNPADRLAALQQRRRELAATLADIERRGRFVSQDQMDAQRGVERAQRALLNGSGSEDDVAVAEQRLAAARAEREIPWSARSVGARSALRDADRAVSGYAAEHYGELSAELNAQALGAAAAVDAAVENLVAAVGERQRLVREATTLWTKVAAPRQRLVPESRCGRLVAEAERIRLAGGEVPGLLPESFLPDRAEVVIPELVDDADVVAPPVRA